MAQDGRHRSDRRESAFTLVELLVVIAILGLLMAIVSPGMEHVRVLTRITMCKSNLGQLNKAISSYTIHNRGQYWMFNHISGDYWYDNIEGYHEDVGAVRLCPDASQPNTGGWGAADRAWRRSGRPGSYGLNLWLTPNDPAPGSGSYYNQFEGNGKADWFWIHQARATAQVPTIGDSPWVGSWPHDFDRVPPNFYYGDTAHAPGYFMGRFCVDRHLFGICMAFVDGSTRRVDLAELWMLKWHRQFTPTGVDIPRP